MLSRFDTIPERDRQTDGRTNERTDRQTDPDPIRPIRQQRRGVMTHEVVPVDWSVTIKSAPVYDIDVRKSRVRRSQTCLWG